MRLFQQFSYNLSKSDTTGSLFAKAREVAESLQKEIPLFFNLEDSSYGSISPVERVLKKFPELHRFEYLASSEYGGETRHSKVLSNLSADWYTPNPNGITDQLVDLDPFEAIANGVPRSYPFKKVLLVFDQLDWFLSGECMDRRPGKITHHPWLLSRPDYLASSICIASESWANRRLMRMEAVIELEPPHASTRTLPELDSTILDRIHTLGKIKNQMFFASPTDEEEQELRELSRDAKDYLTSITEADTNQMIKSEVIAEVALPHALRNRLASGSFENVSPKESINRVFKPRGFKYVSNVTSNGVYCAVKRTKLHNQITLFFDFAPMSRALGWMISCRGPLWEESIELSFSPDQTSHRHPIDGQGELEQVMENAGAIVDYLEGTFVKQLEEIYGPAPAWFVYQG